MRTAYFSQISAWRMDWLLVEQNFNTKGSTSTHGWTRIQIDHVAINEKWVASLKDVRMKRGADINSDHELVVAKVGLSLRVKSKPVVRKKFNLEKVKDDRVRE